jgi:hypothetical protein
MQIDAAAALHAAVSTVRGIPPADVWVAPDHLIVLVNDQEIMPTSRELCLKAGVRAVLGFDADESLLAGEDADTVFATAGLTLKLADLMRGEYGAAN